MLHDEGPGDDWREPAGLPEQTRDDRDEGWGELPEPADELTRRFAERPPHWEE